jgi:hypothetical protein
MNAHHQLLDATLKVVRARRLHRVPGLTTSTPRRDLPRAASSIISRAKEELARRQRSLELPARRRRDFHDRIFNPSQNLLRRYLPAVPSRAVIGRKGSVATRVSHRAEQKQAETVVGPLLSRRPSTTTWGQDKSPGGACSRSFRFSLPITVRISVPSVDLGAVPSLPDCLSVLIV